MSAFDLQAALAQGKGLACHALTECGDVDVELGALVGAIVMICTGDRRSTTELLEAIEDSLRLARETIARRQAAASAVAS